MTGRVTCGDAGALLRAEAGHGAAARGPCRGALDVQLAVVVAIISDPAPAHGLHRGGHGPARGWIQSVVVGVERVRQAGGQHHRAAPVQQQRLLTARPRGQDAVDAEHPGGHHTGVRRELSEKWEPAVSVLDWRDSVLRENVSYNCVIAAPGLVCALSLLENTDRRFGGTAWVRGCSYTLLTSQQQVSLRSSCCVNASRSCVLN